MWGESTLCFTRSTQSERCQLRIVAVGHKTSGGTSIATVSPDGHFQAHHVLSLWRSSHTRKTTASQILLNEFDGRHSVSLAPKSKEKDIA